jgi:ligand-binding SRPBCC domain-containing protein
MATFARTSALASPRDVVWKHSTNLVSVNREMAPWLRMTFPPEVATATLDDPRLRLGEPIFASWVLFLGVVPVERMQVTLVELDPGRRFVEQSRTASRTLWRHERSIEDLGDDCELTDRLTIEMPIARLTPVFAPLLERFFRHRHRQLVSTFGEARAATRSASSCSSR